MQAFALFSHQLFPELMKLPQYTVMCLIEDVELFKPGRSAAKAVFHRAGLQAIRERLLVKGFPVRYFGADEFASLEEIMEAVAGEKPELLRFYDIGLEHLASRVHGLLEQTDITYRVIPRETHYTAERVGTHFMPKVLPPIEPNRYVEEAARYYMNLVAPTEFEFAYPVTKGDAEEWLEALPALLAAGEAELLAEDFAPLLQAGLLTLEHLENNTPPENWPTFRTFLLS